MTGSVASPDLEQLPHRTNTWAVGFVGIVVAASASVLLLRGDPVMAFAPLCVVLVGYGLWVLPLQYPLYAFLALVTLADLTAHGPNGEGVVEGAPSWVPPLYQLRFVLIENLNKLLHVDAFRISGAEVLLLAILSLTLVRELARDWRKASTRVPSAAPLSFALLLAFLTVVLLEGWGIARGGDIRQSVWQLRYMLWLPIVTLLVAYSFHRTRDLVIAAYAFTCVSIVKVGIGLYYALAIARPAGIRPPVATSHWDTVLFVGVAAMWIGAAALHPTRPRILAALAVAGWEMVGILVNHRRTAFISLPLCMAMLFVLLPSQVKRRLWRAGMYALPVLVVYTAAGRYKHGGVFAPAAAAYSLFAQKDASSATRDIENFNLRVTLKQHPIVGSGWGHEYVEFVQAYDISRVFAQYRYQAHNSILWLWTVGGLLGFTAMWLPLSVGVFLAARSARHARSVRDVVIAYGALAVFVCYLVQAWADLGTQSWTSVAMLACALCASGRLAVETGAWPRSLPLFRTRRQAHARMGYGA